MSTTAQHSASTQAGARVEQARYDVPEGTRGIYAQRIAGRVALVDVPIDHGGRVLLIERHVESLAELQGIVNAYVEQSTEAGMPALLGGRRSLEDVVDELESNPL